MAWRMGIVGPVQPEAVDEPVDGMIRADHGRGSSQWWPTTRPRPQLGEEVGRAVEVGHLDVRRADARRARAHRSRRRQQTVLVGELAGPPVEAVERRLGVDHLDRVDEPIVGESRRAPARRGCGASGRTGAARRRRRPGRGSPARCVGRRRAERDPLGQEQADDLAGVRPQLLADDDPARQAVGQVDRAVDRVVVGDAQHVDAALDHRPFDLVGRRRAVAAPHRVAVEVDPHPPGRDGLRQMRMADRRRGHPMNGIAVASPTWRSDRSWRPRRAKMLLRHRCVAGSSAATSSTARRARTGRSSRRVDVARRAQPRRSARHGG